MFGSFKEVISFSHSLGYFLDIQGRFCFLGRITLGMHSSMMFMNAFCQFARDMLTSSVIRRSQLMESIISFAFSKSASANLQTIRDLVCFCTGFVGFAISNCRP